MIQSDVVGTDMIRECPVFSFCIFNNTKVKLLARLLQNYFCVLFIASHLGYTMSTCPTTGDVNLDHLVKMIYSVFLHFRVTFFSISAELYLGADTFGLCECPVCSQIFVHSF